MTVALEGGEWSAARSGRTLPPGKTWYPFYKRLGVPQGRSGLAENLVPTGIQSRTVQPVAQSLYRLSYRAHYIHVYMNIIFVVPIKIHRNVNHHSKHVTMFSKRPGACIYFRLSPWKLQSRCTLHFRALTNFWQIFSTDASVYWWCLQ